MSRFRRTANILRIIGATSIMGIALNLFVESARIGRYLDECSNLEERGRIGNISRSQDYRHFLIPFYNLFDDRYKSKLNIK
ncbi:MAG: hypothetical protein AABX10_00335 [Nanoarchaeota archaeon]